MAVEYNCILIRFGEIFLKGNNRNYFESLLIKNIKNSLSGLNYRFSKTQGRYYIEEFLPEDMDEIISRLTKVFGIHSISPTVKVKTDVEEMCKIAHAISPTEGTFRVTVKRADKRFPMTSMELGAKIGGYMLNKTGGRLKVDLFDYDFELFVDLRESGYSYLFYDKIMGAQGLPTGCSGNAMLLLSGGIDSPVAGYVMAKRGLRIFAIHYHSFPYTSELALQKVKDLAKKLTAYCGDIKLAVVPFTEIQEQIKDNCPEELFTIIMRRLMMKTAEKIVRKVGCEALITGESVGQVASQTIGAIACTDCACDMPVFRPLIGMDKEEIVKIARRIDTFETSILPYEDCCTVFTPRHPKTKPRIAEVLEAEQKVAFDELIEKAIEQTEHKFIY